MHVQKKIDNNYVPVGDVTFSEYDMPIVVSKKYRKQGIGNQVIQCLIRRARQLRYRQIDVKENYNFNIGSQKLFEGNGFVRGNTTENGASYFLNIKSN